jgi:Group II intron, maturase-specific domain
MQTPHRFRSKRQLWTYSGLGIETHDSAQYRFVRGQLQRSKKPQQLRGLNQNHNHEMKEIFKGAATRASCGVGPLREFYVALLDKGMRPEMARLSMETTIAELAPYMRGWRSYFGFCETPEVLIYLTRWVRLRLRAALWRQWRTPRRRRAALLALGVRPRLANNTAGSGRGP